MDYMGDLVFAVVIALAIQAIALLLLLASSFLDDREPESASESDARPATQLRPAHSNETEDEERETPRERKAAA
jgi:hypothetical protein